MGARSPGACRFIALVLAIGSAHCGKLESQELPRAHPSGADPDASIADGGAPPDDCPTSRTLIELGASCTWTGTCPVSLDVCGTGVGITLATLCASGTVASPKGMPTCSLPPASDASIPPTEPCPSRIVAGATCQFVGTCTVQYCSPTQPLLCTCEEGAWDCPGAADCSPGAECTLGAQCLAPEKTCVIAGGGPCGSDTRLVCSPDMAYVPYDSLCDEHATSCTSISPGQDGGPGCTQSCSCADRVMACSGCPG